MASMSVPIATAEAILVLSAAGTMPVLALVGRRWIAIPLAPLTGAVAAAGAATVEVFLPGPFVLWFVLVAVAGAGAGIWWLSRARRPGAQARDVNTDARLRWMGAAGALAIFVTCAIALRGLQTATVGFDARALWLMRAGWLLQGHHQFLADLRLRELSLPQTAYPPLVSSVTALAWSVTGMHTDRLGVTVVAVLNACALAAAALAVVQCGIGAAGRAGRRLSWMRAAAAQVAAPLLVVVGAGVTSPFLTNGYADPIWSLAAVGTVAWGLQVQAGAPGAAVAALLVLVAGLSKDEGVVVGAALAVLVAARAVIGSPAGQRLRRARAPVAAATVELCVLAAWPVAMRVVRARGTSMPSSSPARFIARSHAVAVGFAPYLHVLVLAVPLAILGGLVLGSVRRQARLGNDAWAWAGLAAGLLAVGGAVVAGKAAVRPWLVTTVHRITEFPVLAAWWIVALWGVVGAAAVAAPVPTAATGAEGSDREALPAQGPLAEEPVTSG